MFDEMMDEIIKRFGFEATETINFCIICERVERGHYKEEEIIIENLFKLLMED